MKQCKSDDSNAEPCETRLVGRHVKSSSKMCIASELVFVTTISVTKHATKVQNAHPLI